MIISSLQIATCLERCGDYGRNLAKRSDLGLSKIPELMKGLGSGIKEFKKASKEDMKNNNLDDDNTASTN